MKTFAAPREANTLVEVAQQMGVSTATVSRELSRSELVAPPTLVRVLRGVEALNYQPNRLARGLRRKESGVIGLAAPDISSPFPPRLFIPSAFPSAAFAFGKRS